MFQCFNVSCAPVSKNHHHKPIPSCPTPFSLLLPTSPLYPPPLPPKTPTLKQIIPPIHPLTNRPHNRRLRPYPIHRRLPLPLPLPPLPPLLPQLQNLHPPLPPINLHPVHWYRQATAAPVRQAVEAPVVMMLMMRGGGTTVAPFRSEFVGVAEIG